jgi:hypothetical protein
MAVLARGLAEHLAEERERRIEAAKAPKPAAAKCWCVTGQDGTVQRCAACWRASWERGHALPDPWE